MNKWLVLFVEGDTEVEFYKQVIANARRLRPNGMFDTSIECKSINGVGGFKNIVLRKFVKEIKTKYDEDCVFTVVLCRDTDVFELSPKPPIKWNEVERDLRASGATDVIHVEARHSIEDWFLYDAEGIISFLRLNKKTKVTGKDGYDKLKRLYKQVNNNTPRSRHHMSQRIVMQGITGVNERYRLKMTLADVGVFCANSVNYLLLDNNIEYFLALCNSKLLNWYFAKLSTNSNVNGYEVDNLPIKIADDETMAEIKELVQGLLVDSGKTESIDKLNELVYLIYGLDAAEIYEVERMYS